MRTTPQTWPTPGEPPAARLIIAQVVFGILFCSAVIAAGAYLPGDIGPYITHLNIIVMTFVYMGIVKRPWLISRRLAASIAVGTSLMWGFLSLQEHLVGIRPVPDDFRMRHLVAALLTIYGLAEGAAFTVRRYVWAGFKVIFR